MPFVHNSKGVNPNGGYTPIPEGEYKFVIESAKETTSKKGLPMIEATISVIEHPELHGKSFKHYVVFIPAGEKGDGMNVHFRRCIGVPYGGEDEVNAADWEGKKLRAKVKIEKSSKDGKEYINNKVAAVFPYGDDFPEIKETEIPF
jgi:hypothetical protein